MTYYYVYCITNISTNKKYIGSRKCEIEPENDLGFYYFSSSRNKEFMNDQKINPTFFEYEVLKIFNNYNDMLNYEIFLHNFYDVGKNKLFYNLSKQTSTGFSTNGCKMSKKFEMTDEIKQKISNGLKKYFALHKQEKYLKPKIEPKNVCKHCGNKTNHNFFCSKKCMNEYLHNKKESKKKYKCMVCGIPINKKYCCSKKCFNIYLKNIDNEYSRTLSQKRIDYIKENYSKICEINQNIANTIDQKSKGLKISETKFRNNSGNNNASTYGRIIKIFDNIDNLRYIIKSGESVKDFCLKHNMPLLKIKSSYQRNVKIFKGEFKGWYCIKEEL